MVAPTTATKPTSAPDEPRPYYWTLEEYRRCIDLGVFAGKKIELINGELIEMAAQGNDHIVGVRLCTYALRDAFGDGYIVQSQAPITGKDDSEPEPDVIVIKGSLRDAEPKPRSPALVVEVSDATLRQDRVLKAATYAKAGIADYWILNLKSRCLEVHRQPDPDESRFSHLTTLHPGDTISPLAKPEASINVEDLLP